MPPISSPSANVGYTAPRGLYAPPGIYVVTAKLPERDGEFEYHIRHTSELHERIARENRGFERRGGVACAKCGGRGNKIDARPNWKEQPPS